jgi:hypothetical protein
MKNSMKACLFGGTLLAAGIANAQEFIIAGTDTTGAYPTFAVSQGYGGSSQVAYGPGSLNTSSVGTTGLTGTTSMSTIQTSTLLRAEGSWDGAGSLGYGYGLARFQVFFQVSQNADLVISWDVTATDAYASSIVLEDVSGATLFVFDGLSGDPLSGTATISLQAGVDYVYLGGLVRSGFGPFIFGQGTKFVQAELIPAPGAFALLGLAGLAGSRRRRG